MGAFRKIPPCPNKTKQNLLPNKNITNVRSVHVERSKDVLCLWKDEGIIRFHKWALLQRTGEGGIITNPNWKCTECVTQARKHPLLKSFPWLYFFICLKGTREPQEGSLKPLAGGTKQS